MNENNRKKRLIALETLAMMASLFGLCGILLQWKNTILLILVGIEVVLWMAIFVLSLKKENNNNNTDEITNLANLHQFCIQAKNVLNANKNKAYILAYTDIDRFKFYNDTFGSKKGDRVITKIGDALSNNEHSNLILAGHCGGDNFVLLFEEKRQDPSVLYNIIEKTINQSDVDYNFTTRIGFHYVIDNKEEVRELIDKAELALESIKNSYDKNWAVFNNSMYDSIIKETKIAESLKRALENKEFVPYYQIQYDYLNKKIVGIEALIRWINPEKGIIPPGEFIPVFEKNSSIYEVDKYIWNEVAASIYRWKQQGIKIVPVSVNVSRSDIYHIDFIDTISKIVLNHHIDYEDLRIEITESAYMQNPEALIETVTKLKELGFYVEMDDFGSGYSSLNTLKDLPCDLVKLDMNFMRSSLSIGKGGSILSSVVRLAHQINIPVIAEGVETIGQADFLKSIGCYFMQGYLFSKPVKEEEYLKLLQNYDYEAIHHNLSDNSITDGIDFLDDRTQYALLFNSYVGGAFILEMVSDNVSVLRTNDLFFKEVDITRQSWDKAKNDLGKLFEKEEYEKLTNALWSAVKSKEDSDETLWTKVKERKIWIHIRCRYLSKKINSYLFYCYVENVTKAVEDNNRLKVSEEEYKAVAIQSQKLVCRYNILKKALIISPEMADAFDSVTYLENAPEAFIEKGYIAKESIENWKNLFARIEAGEQSGEITEVSIANLSGVFHWYRISFSNIRAEESENEVAILAFTDITKEREIKHSKAMEFHGVVEALSGIYTLSVTCNLSKNTYSILSFDNALSHQIPIEGSYDELIENNLQNIPDKIDRENFKNAFSRNNILATWKYGAKKVILEHKQRDEQGFEHWIETSALYVEDSENREILHILVAKNIDEQKLNEETLKHSLEESERKLSITQKETIIASSMAELGKIICYYDIPSRTLWLSKEYAATIALPSVAYNFPYCDEETVKRLVNKEDLKTYKKFYQDIFDGKQRGSMEIEYIVEGNKTIWEKDEYNLLYDEEGKPIRAIISIEDTTLQHEENYKQQALIRKLESLISTAFKSKLEYLILIDTQDFSYEIYMENGDSHDVSKESSFVEATIQIANEKVLENEKEEYLKNADIHTVIEKMHKDGNYSYQYNLEDGRRKAEFYWADSNKTSLIMTVSNIQKEYEGEQGIIAQAFVKKQIAEFEKEKDTSVAIDNLLQALGEYTNANICFFFSEDENHEKVANEWHMPGINSTLESVKESSYENFKPDFECGHDNYYVKDIAIFKKDNEFIYNFLKNKGIFSYITFPLIQEGRPLGIIGIDNPNHNKIELIRNIFFVLTRTVCERLSFEKQKKRDKEINEIRNSTIETISSLYVCAWEIDVEKEYVDPISDDDYTELVAGKAGYNAKEAFAIIIHDMCDEENKTGLEEYLNFERIKKTLPELKTEYYTYHSKRLNWVRLVLTATRSENGALQKFIVGFQDIGKEKEAEENLNKENIKNSLVYNASSSGVWNFNFDEKGNMIEVNWSDGFRHLLGYEENEFENKLESWTSCLHPNDKDNTLKMFYNAINEDELYDVRYRLMLKTGVYHWFRAVGKITRRLDKSPIVFAGALFDINKDVIREQESKLNELKYTNVLRSVGIGTWSYEFEEGKKERLYIDEIIPSILEIEGGLSPEESSQFFVSRIKKEDLSKIEETIKNIAEGNSQELIFLWNHPTKGEIYVRAGGYSDNAYEGKGSRLIGFLQVVNESVIKEKKMMKELQTALENYREADYDKRRDFLTGLYNRLDMFEMIEHIKENKAKVEAIYMMDIDNYKKYNDRYGHGMGDECLKKIGKALVDYAKDKDIRFYRYGGEEILGISLLKTDPKKIGEKLMNLIQDLNIERDDTPFGRVTVSLGYTTDGSNLDKMIDKADIAMYKAKALGKNQMICYEDLKDVEN